MAVYPSGIKTWANKIDGVDNILAAHMNEAYAEIIAIETDLGAGGVYTPTGFKVGSFTRDMATVSGTQAITGVGFTPRAVIFLSACNNALGSMSLGIDNLSNAGCVIDNNNAITDTWAHTETLSIYIIQAGGNVYNGKIYSLDSDGFTVFWDRIGTTGILTVNYIAIR